MEILLELQDIKRFRRADQLATYVGLTPSQYSSADKTRMGRITGIGKNSGNVQGYDCTVDLFLPYCHIQWE